VRRTRCTVQWGGGDEQKCRKVGNDPVRVCTPSLGCGLVCGPIPLGPGMVQSINPKPCEASNQECGCFVLRTKKNGGLLWEEACGYFRVISNSCSMSDLGQVNTRLGKGEG
jgi:hypothetical protein